MCEDTIYRQCTKTAGENVSGTTAMRSWPTYKKKEISGNDQFSPGARICEHVISSTPPYRKLRFRRHFVQRIRVSLHCREPQTNYCFEHFCSRARHATISTQHRIFCFDWKSDLLPTFALFFHNFFMSIYKNSDGLRQICGDLGFLSRLCRCLKFWRSYLEAF